MIYIEILYIYIKYIYDIVKGQAEMCPVTSYCVSFIFLYYYYYNFLFLFLFFLEALFSGCLCKNKQTLVALLSLRFRQDFNVGYGLYIMNMKTSILYRQDKGSMYFTLLSTSSRRAQRAVFYLMMVPHWKATKHKLFKYNWWLNSLSYGTWLWILEIFCEIFNRCSL